MEVKKRTLNRRKLSRSIFYWALMILPLIQFGIFYVYVNLNSVILSVQKYAYKLDDFGYDISFAAFENFEWAFTIIKDKTFLFENSFKIFLICTVLGFSLSLIFSYYIYKKKFASGFFKTVLFLPQIISGLIFGVLFQYIVSNVYPQIALDLFGLEVEGLFDNADTKFGTLIFYNVWVSFGVSILMYTGAMSGIDQSIVESAHLDGANTIREFWSITIPMIWPTIVSFLIINISGILTNQFGVFNMFGINGGDLSNIGYSIYVWAQSAQLVDTSPTYSQLSALGVLLTVILVPTVLIIRKLLTKYGPRED